MIFFEKFAAVLKRNYYELTSYRIAFLVDYAGLFASVVIFFYISLLFPEAKVSLGKYGAQNYFSFALVGIAFMGLQSVALTSFSQALAAELMRGTLETIVMTRTSMVTLMLIQFLTNTIKTILNILLYLILGMLLSQSGIDFSTIHWGSAFLCGILTLASLSGLGIASAAFLLAFKKGDPISYTLHGLSRIFSGIYFPIALLPFWMQKISMMLPLTHALNGFRKAVLQGLPPAALGMEFTSLGIFSLITIPAGIFFYSWCFKKAKKDGSLAFH